MLNKSFVNYGANIKLTIAGDPADVAVEVLRLTNYGAIVLPPDDYHEGQDEKVTVDSSRDRLIRALITQADNDISLSIATHKLRANKRQWHAAAIFRAARKLRTYEKRSGSWQGGAGYTVATTQAETGFGNGE